VVERARNAAILRRVEVQTHARGRTLCGLPAETIHYLMPVMGNIAPHPATAVAAVLNTDDITYVASVTAQATDAANPTYQRDVDTMLKGFQLLPPSQT
jgi:hypothetical protein